MKNRGFTLIEIIAVIIIMGILLLIVFPATSRIMRGNDEKKYDTYYDIVEAGLEKYGRTRRSELGGSTSTGCFDDKTLQDLIDMGYVKEFDQEDDVVCGTPNEFDLGLLKSWGYGSDYANLRVEGNEGKIDVSVSLICVKKNADGTYARKPVYDNLVEASECIPDKPQSTVGPTEPTPQQPESSIYYTITYNANGGSSCTKTSDSLMSGQSVDLTPSCTRSGYSFDGWSKTSNGAEVKSLTVENADITLYARWKSSGSSSYDGCYSSETTSNNLIVKRNNSSSTVKTWTNQPVSFKVQSSNGTVYATWDYSQSNVEIRTERKDFSGEGPNGSNISVYACVYYDSKNPTVSISDHCYKNEDSRRDLYTVIHNVIVKDVGSGIESIYIDNVQKYAGSQSNSSDLTIKTASSSQIISATSLYKPISVRVCDFAGNCTTSTYQASSVNSSGTACK